MSLIKRNRPSPAMIIAVVALSFALVGTAVAGTDVASRALTKSKVKSIAKKQADKELRANISGSHVNLADNATTAANANALGGQSAASYESKVRWVLILPNGSIAAQSGGITVTHPGTGQYEVNFGVQTAGKALVGSSSLASDNTFRGSIEAVPCTNAAPEGLPAACGAVNPNTARFFISNPANTANQDHAFYATLIP